MTYKQQQHLRSLLTDAIIELCRRESFYVEELRIEGTICIVSDRSSVVIAQITEQVGEKFSEGDAGDEDQTTVENDSTVTYRSGEFNSQTNPDEELHSNDSCEDDDLGEDKATAELSGPPGNSQASGLEVNHLDDAAMNIGLEVAEQLANIMSIYSKVPKSSSDAENSASCGHSSSFSCHAFAQEPDGYVPCGSLAGCDDQAPLERSEDGKFRCPYCMKSYGFKHTLKEHINKHLGKRPNVCKHCGDSFTHLASLCAHMKKRHDDLMPADFQCGICGEKLMNYQSLKQHYTWRHKDVKFPEDRMEQDADMVATANGTNPDLSLKPMRRRRSRRENFIRSEVDGFAACGVETRKKIKLEFPDEVNNTVQLDSSALLEAFERKEYESIQEGISLLENSGFEGSDGRLRETSAIGFQKTDCTSDTLKYAQLIAKYFDEIYVETENGIHRYRCKFCGNTFKVRNSLYEHLNSHFGKKPHICNFCGDCFAHHSSLHNHVRNKHSFQTSAEREASLKHLCVGCDRKFRYRSELERHLKCNPEHAIGGI